MPRRYVKPTKLPELPEHIISTPEQLVGSLAERHPGALGILRALDGDGGAIDANLARIGRHRTTERLHECALAGAIFPEEGERLAGLEAETHPAEGFHAGEGLHDAAHPEQGRLRARR